jgi:tRNA (Thr-GGU) A37 N-methylase
MKYLKRFNESVEEGSLKDRLIDFYNENEANYDPEETVNSLEILDEYDDNLTGLKYWDKVILQRILDDSDLYAEVEEAGGSGRISRDNAFDDDPFS